jgi:two-component system sensor histidine kinase PhoQ
VLTAVLHWALRPLRRLADQLTQLDSGQQQQLQGDWPRELQAVTGNLNALLQGERTRIARYRQTLGNLAHSLKTPLAVIRSALSNEQQDAAGLAAASINDQLQVMSSLVDHHLKRAGSGGVTLGQPLVALAPIAQQLRLALLKVHARKDLLIELTLPAGLGFAGDPDDLYEILGNLMDNAAKWCRGHMRVSATLEAGSRRLCVLVEDDGPGIAPADRERVLQRGVRADQLVPGHGLGLSMVLEQAGLYGGNLQLAEADLGGLQVQLQLPGGSMAG